MVIPWLSFEGDPFRGSVGFAAPVFGGPDGLFL